MKTVYILLALVILTDCSNTKFKNPKDAAEEFSENLAKMQFNKAYNLLSDSSKKYFTQDEFSNYYKSKSFFQSINNPKITVSENSISSSSLLSTFRSFSLSFSNPTEPKGIDTTFNTRVTTFLENGSWTIVWYEPLIDEFSSHVSKDYDPGHLRNLYNCFEFDPINPNCAYALSKANLTQGLAGQAFSYAKKADELKYPPFDLFLLYSAIFSNQSDFDLALYYLKKARAICVSKLECDLVRLNFGIAYSNLNMYDSAIHYLKYSDAIQHGNKYSDAAKLYLAENYYYINEYTNSIKYFNMISDINSLKDDNKERYHYYYAKTLFHKAKVDIEQRSELLLQAKLEAIKFRDISTNNYLSGQLLEEIRQYSQKNKNFLSKN
ncbi:MAG TPA: NTF2-like N-terminal transpeptidase domain-containing protein [Chitinophagaceae bacterium]|nr:NTF2-like N-terminal transpeptidase domain-containing protein [Chitinophagaceae bacterium]